jgi:hypothetical protein
MQEYEPLFSGVSGTYLFDIDHTRETKRAA